MVVIPNAVVLFLFSKKRQLKSCAICAGILCKESVCFAQKSQPTGKVNFLET